ncbi:radical SAM protein, partial [candidate division WOR-3 bacterium]|nr:radical SAM protein [candidate division WOR-3 bacterium]
NAEKVENALLSAGFEKTEGQSDFSIIFACSVTEQAQNESEAWIRKMGKTSKKVFVSGCHGKKAGDGNEILAELAVSSPSTFSKRKRARPVVSIQEGCNSFCSFCVINSLRGRPISRDVDDVACEVQSLEKSGYSEVVLSGISLGKIKNGLGRFLKELLLKTGNIRFRLGSLNPQDIKEDGDFIEVFAQNRIMPYVHLSLQSGSDRVLKDMMRRYNTSEVWELLSVFRKNRSKPGIGVDVIAGFPTETMENHMETVRFLEKTQPSFAHVFPYSARKGTLSNLYPDEVGKDDRNLRAFHLRDFMRKSNLVFLKNLVGEERTAIVERKNGESYVLRVDNFAVAETFTKEKVKVSSAVRIKIFSFDEKTNTLKAEILGF